MRYHPSKTCAGSVLLTVIIFTALLCVLVCSTLVLVNSKNTLTVRSMDWNNAMPLAEAGIEEALTQLQVVKGNNFLTNGWTSANGKFYKFGTNLVNYGYYTVVIQPTNYQVGIGPTIVATGYVAVPFGSINLADAPFTSVSVGGGTNSFIHRTVTVATRLRGGYLYAVLVKDFVNISQGIIDSFDSSNPSYSTGGLYDPTKREANAIVGSTTTSSSIYQIGNGLIYGSVGFGASSGNPQIQNGRVGDINYDNNSAHNGMFQGSHVINNFNPDIPDATAPFTSGNVILTGSYPYGGNTYYYNVGDGNYSTVGDFQMSDSAHSMLVSGKATIYIGGGFNQSGSATIYIAPGGSLTMYVAGSQAQISGGGVVNGTGVAANCAIYGLPGCTQVTYSGSANYVGTVYAPEATLNFSGSADISGAVVGNSCTFSGGMNLHYDESLGTGGKLNYAVSSWQELP